MTAPVTARTACHAWRHIAPLALGIMIALGACTDRDPVSASPRAPRAALTDEQGYSRLIVGVDAADARFLAVEVEGRDLERPLSWRFERDEKAGELFGTIAVPAGEGRVVVLRALDGEGRELYVGKSEMMVEKEFNPQLRLTLDAVGERVDEQLARGGAAPEGWVGSYRIAVTPGTLGEPSEKPLLLTVTVRDPDGEAMPIGPEDLDWQWPREVGELEVVYSGRDAFEASAWWRYKVIDQEIKLAPGIVICSQQVKGCRPVNRPPFTFPFYTKVVGGGTHTCALNRWSTVKCWGSNGSGQLGIDAAGNDLVASHAFADVSAGFEHTCAIDTQGQAWCWGSNAYAQSGFQGYYPTNVATPVLVKNAPPFTQIAAGGRHTCALSTTGEIWCWGEWRYGQLGDGQFYQSSAGYDQKPHRVDSYEVFAAVSAGESHSCGVTSTGQVWCWGLNTRGQTGGVWQKNYGVMDAYHCQLYASATLYDCNRRPNQVQSIPGSATKIASGGHRNCALSTSQDIYCWGAFALGGNSPTPDNLYPVLVVANGGSVQFTAVGVGTNQSCGVATDGAVWCWGYGGSGQLGNGTNSYVATIPVQASGQLPLASSLGLGGTHSCALDASRRGILCWGLGSSGQLGTGTAVWSLNVPTSVTVF